MQGHSNVKTYRLSAGWNASVYTGPVMDSFFVLPDVQKTMLKALLAARRRVARKLRTKLLK